MRITWGWGLVAVGLLLGAAGAVLFERPIMLAFGALPVAAGVMMIRSGYRSGLRD